MALADFKIFKTNRLRFSEMHDDVMTYIKRIYRSEGQEFTEASPFAQMLTVITHLGRMIFYYIESSISELNINTAFRTRSIKGLATLTGHMPSQGIAARGSLYMTYNMNEAYAGTTITLKNFSKIRNTANGMQYLAVFPNNSLKLTVGSHDSKIEFSIIQGTIKYQQSTGNGEALQSINFANKAGETIDNFFINVYVNGERWLRADSLLDLGYNQKGCVVRPSLNGGIDVFFGTGANGAIPVTGSSILCEYLVTMGSYGNISSATNDNYWVFDDVAYDSEGNAVNLNEIYSLSSASEILFGTDSENIEITRQLAPHMSRSFVLANPINYKYFLTKLNIFSIIDAFSGFRTIEDTKIETKYLDAKAAYETAKENYRAEIQLTGKTSEAAEELYDIVIAAENEYNVLKQKYNDSQLDDNIIYLYLVPDISKRINTGENYFTCSLDRFMLSEDEKLGIQSIIEDSGQKIITVDNKIIDPTFARFSINIFIHMWENYNFDMVKSSIVSVVSNYLIKNTRRDRLPVSDIVTLIEGVAGVDSVTVAFDADKNNSYYYGEGHYGLDEYGDIVLSRDVKDTLGNTMHINDILPLFRGPFTSPEGVEYSDDMNSLCSTINITLRGRSNN